MNESEEKLDANTSPIQPASPIVPAQPVVKTWQKVLRFWWIPVSFAVPALCTHYLTLTRDHKEDLEGALKIGQIGLYAAVMVWGIWRLDVLMGARQRLSDSETVVKVIAHLTGYVLWVCWFCAFVIISMAIEQVYSLPTTLPNLPG